MLKARLDKIAPIEDWVQVARRRIPNITLRYLESDRRMESKMTKPRTFRLMTFGSIMTGALFGCQTFGKCGFQGCPGDAQTTVDAKALLDKHPELGTSIDVQTIDHVVYLYGLVDTPLESEIAKSVVLEAPGVARVESSVTSQN